MLYNKICLFSYVLGDPVTAPVRQQYFPNFSKDDLTATIVIGLVFAIPLLIVSDRGLWAKRPPSQAWAIGMFIASLVIFATIAPFALELFRRSYMDLPAPPTRRVVEPVQAPLRAHVPYVAPIAVISAPEVTQSPLELRDGHPVVRIGTSWKTKRGTQFPMSLTVTASSCDRVYFRYTSGSMFYPGHPGGNRHDLSMDDFLSMFEPR
jgi:hypothetical protein